MKNSKKKMKTKSEKMRTALRMAALVLLLGAGLGQLAAQPLPKGKTGKGTRADDKGYVMDKNVNEAGDMLTLESYVKSKKIGGGGVKPMDFCLVLDASGSLYDSKYMTTVPAGWRPVYDKSTFSYNDVNTTNPNNFYYFKWFDGTNENYIRVMGLLGYTTDGTGSQAGTNYKVYTWLYFDYGGYRYFLAGNTIYKAAANTTYTKPNASKIVYPKDIYGNEIPTIIYNTTVSGNPNSSSANIWTGSLYRQRPQEQVPEEYLVQDAVASFLATIRQSSLDNIDEETHQPVNHRVSLVKFATDLCYNDGYGSRENAWLTLAESPNLNTLTEGTHGALTGPGTSTGKNYCEVMSNFYNTSDIFNYNKLRTIGFSARAGGNTATIYGVAKARALLDDATNPYNNGTVDNANKEKVMVVFTDGELNLYNPHNDRNGALAFHTTAANQTIEMTRVMKEKGYKVYCIGLFHTGNENDNAHKLIKYMSSSFPNATAMNNSGTEDTSKKYYFSIENSAELAQVFIRIAEEAGAAAEWSEETVVQDVISEYFQLPAGTTESNINVQTADCIGINEAGELIFGTPNDFPQAEIEINGSTIRVKNFDFSANFCGDHNPSGEPLYQGKKLIINIPIEPKPGTQPGIHPTNAPGSTIFPNGDETKPTDPFEPPQYYVKGETWVEHTHANPGTAAINQDGDGVYHIYNEEGLAWFISIVCGYNGMGGNASAQAVLDADVDMSAYIWVPIGGWGYCNNVQTPGGNDFAYTYPKAHGFSGTFDGQGHVIRGLNNADPVSMPQTGMFGYVNGGTVKNTFVVGCNFQAAVGQSAADKLCTGTEGHFGIIADTLCANGTIFNCEAEGILKTFVIAGKMYDDTDYEFDAPSQDPTKCYLGGLVGLVGRNQAGSTSAAKVHSCISVATLAGYSMGGCVNEVALNSDFQNSYSYALFRSWMPNIGTDLGGLVAKNAGKVQNCYLRNRADATIDGGLFTGIYGAVQKAGTTAKNRDEWHKGLLLGQNSGSATGIYVPKEWKDCPAKDTDNNAVCFVGYGDDSNEAQGVGWFSDAETPYLYRHNDTRVTMLPNTPAGRLLQTLNAWVGTTDGAGCTLWMRTTANGINNDYPVLNISDFDCVASDDQVVLFYGDVNETMATTRKLMTSEKADDVIYLYKNKALTTGNNGATLYIDEKVAVKQTADIDKAYVGITLDNSAGAAGANSNHPFFGFEDDAIDWHMFATPLTSAPLGIDYANDETAWPFSYAPTGMPCYRFINESDGKPEHDGYFPSHTYGTTYGTEAGDYYHDWDFYCWSEKYYHYINFKRNSKSHWTEGHDLNLDLHSNIPYTNETYLIPGKGYMLAVATETFLQSHGTLNNGVLTTNVTCSDNPFCPGYNLIGNPYQSYLDFDEFARVNGIGTYAILDEDATGYISYAAGSTGDPLRYVNMHQGFYVKVAEGGTVTFNNDMRNITATTTTFRGGDAESYPHLKLTLTEDNGMRDYARVEFDRPELGGGEKFKDLRAGNAQIYLHNGDTDYSTLFATSDLDEVALRFSTLADGTYTLSWELGDGDFGEMYLVDNINGQKTDMLTHSSYKFEGRSSDYASRFRLVFSLNNGEEDSAEAETDAPFAFQMDGSLVVNGQGSCQVFDLTGRLVGMAELTDSQSTLPLPQVNGIYVVRLAGDNGTKVQKIVVRQ